MMITTEKMSWKNADTLFEEVGNFQEPDCYCGRVINYCQYYLLLLFSLFYFFKFKITIFHSKFTLILASKEKYHYSITTHL